MNKTKMETSSETEKSIKPDIRIKLIGILIIILSFFWGLSLIFFSEYDSAVLVGVFSDIGKMFSGNSEFLLRVQSSNNLMGILGAYLSDFFIRNTLGYFSVGFAISSGIFGFFLVSERDVKNSLSIIALIISGAFIFASLFGLISAQFEFLQNSIQYYGKIGLYIGLFVSKIFGVLGGMLFFSILFLIETAIIFKVKVEDIVNLFKVEPKNKVKPEKEDFSESIKNTEKVEDSIERSKEIVIEEKTDFVDDTEELNETIIPEPTISDVSEEPAQDKEDEIVLEIDSEYEYINENKSDDVNIILEPEDEINQIENEQKTVALNFNESEEIEKPKDLVDLNDIEIKDYDNENLPEPWEEQLDFVPPGTNMLEDHEKDNVVLSIQELEQRRDLLIEKLKIFDIEVTDVEIKPGPVVTMFEIKPSANVKISKITGLENDIALALAARGIRIIAPIPGKSAIGIEIPNDTSANVGAKTVIEALLEMNSSGKLKAKLPLALGKTITGEIYITDLAKIPHLLIAGATGSGKSVGINMLITSLIFAKKPSEVKFIIIDPKKIELSFYKRLLYHYLAVSPDIDEEIITTPQNALLVLNAALYEMDKRYLMLQSAGERNLEDYNKKVTDPKKKPRDTDSVKHYQLPYIVIVIDELADLMMTSGKEVEEPITRLAQMARAVGIHLIVATQRPSVNVITGLIKANFSARIAYQVVSRIDSRTILDMGGAERLLGRGDMLFLPSGEPKPIRIQNAFISTNEIEKLTNYVYTQPGFSKRYFLPSMFDKTPKSDSLALSDLDELFEEAARLVIASDSASTSYLQRRLKLGYSRAARIMDQLEDVGIIGPSDGTKPREVLINSVDELEAILRSL